MSNLPSGTVTFLFTDIEGSTQLWEKHPEAMKTALARHDALLREIYEAHLGHVFKTVGDAFCVAFESTLDALNAAVASQNALFREPWGEAVIKVRMALHCGEVETRDNDYFGQPLNRVARLLSAGHGGQVLISTAIQEQIGDSLPPGISLRDMGERRLKDLIRPEHIYQLVIPGLPVDFASLKTLDTFRTNLPAQLTSFIGREKEIAEIKKLLGQNRLVTLTGVGGTGKTRLSIEVAINLLEQYPDGLWFVELASLLDPDLIPPTILSSLGITEQAGKPSLDVLKEYLHEKKALIILDNCEHLIGASAQVTSSLLSVAPQLKMLASSREALGIQGEVSYPVPSLSLPDPKHIPAIEKLVQYEAVQLFIARALLVNPHFVVNKDNAIFIAQICSRLDGIPLAIELAAARVKVLSVEQISKRLDDRFRLLAGSARSALPRQQTLRALIDWSHDLLSADERLLLRRLSVFAGGWTLEAAEDVCSDSDQSGITEILDLITQLVNKSLVIVVEQPHSGEMRYRMLETIRQYTREKLLEAGGGEVIREKHLAYFVKLAEQAEPELYRSNQVFWFHKLDDEIDNLRMALEWASATNVASGLRIAVALMRFWDSHGYLQEIEGRLGQLLEQYETNDSLHAQSVAVHAYFIFILGNPGEASKLIEHSLQMARALSDKHTEALGLYFLGMCNQYQGRMQEGDHLLEQSLALYRTLGNKIGQANTLEALGTFGNDMEQSIAFVRESLELYRALGNLSGIANILHILARLTIYRGDFSAPGPWLEEALSLAHQLGNKINAADVLTVYGILFYRQGDYQRSIAYHNEAALLLEDIELPGKKIWFQIQKSEPVLRQGDVQQAYKILEGCILRAQKENWVFFVVYAIERLASLHVSQNQPERAARLFAWVDDIREKTTNHRPPVEQTSVDKDWAIIHSKVNDTEFAKLSAEGRAMTIEQAIAIALEKTHE